MKAAPRGPALYDYDAASKMTGYTPGTIRRYCEDGRLRKGIDHIIKEYWIGRYRRRARRLTRVGIARLLHRNTV